MKNIKIKGNSYPFPDSNRDKTWGPQVTDFADGAADAINENADSISDQAIQIDEVNEKIEEINEKLEPFTGGSSGLVPEASPEDAGKFLKSDGTWADAVPSKKYLQYILVVADALNPELTLPVDPTTSLPGAFVVGDNQLIFCVNGLEQRLGDDYTEVGSGVSSKIQFIGLIEVGDTLSFRIV